MQRLSLGSPAGRPSRVSAAGEEEDAGAADEKAAKAVARGAPAAPDRTIHLVPVLTLLCFLVLFLLSHDPSAAALTDSPVLAAAATVAARSLDAAAAGAGGCPRISSAADGAATRGFRGVFGCQLLTFCFPPLSAWLFGVAADATTASSGVYRRLKQSRVRRLGVARRGL
ncbi:uncharacterized protein LOC120651553 isoform X1 [Panicum virgatum]|uniref:uncharacterized protein LOC120651553 isoform X1 n=1 Tax=Panicum virgatum TaxID=38727 RepID=UPI0019D5CA96|nr:uncharacterized protein LOC120651553 isoform X1 [Panicum virgatum]